MRERFNATHVQASIYPYGSIVVNWHRRNHRQFAVLVGHVVVMAALCT